MGRAAGEVSQEIAGPPPSRGPGAAAILAERKRAKDEAAARESNPPAPQPRPEPDPSVGDEFKRGLAEGKKQPGPRVGGYAVSDGAGVVLGFLMWVWVVLPFIKGGPTNVRNVLRAKLTNKGADGSELP